MERLRLYAVALLLMLIIGSGVQAQTVTTIAAGGVSQTLFPSGVVSRGCYIQNPLTAAAQNIALAESLWVDFTGAAASPTSGTAMEIQPGFTWACAIPTTGSVTIYGATTGHRFNVMKW